MLILGINTVADACGAALVRDGAVLAELSEPMNQGHDARLAPVVEQLMRETGIAFGELDRIAVIVGPGSFTGVRVGVAFARGLSLALEIAAVGVTSLEAAIPAGLEGPALGCLAAQRRPPEQTWWVQGISDGQGIADVLEVPLTELLPMLTGFHAPVFMDGSEALGDLAAKLDLRPMQPSAITAALKASLFDPAKHPPAPVYARAPDAALPGAKG